MSSDSLAMVCVTVMTHAETTRDLGSHPWILRKSYFGSGQRPGFDNSASPRTASGVCNPKRGVAAQTCPELEKSRFRPQRNRPARSGRTLKRRVRTLGLKWSANWRIAVSGANTSAGACDGNSDDRRTFAARALGVVLWRAEPRDFLEAEPENLANNAATHRAETS